MLDKAKFAAYDQFFDQVEKAKKEGCWIAHRRVRGDGRALRWSSAMQFVFMRAAKRDFRRLLQDYYPDMTQVIGVLSDLKEMELIGRDSVPTRSCSAAAAAPAATAGDRVDLEWATSFLTTVA